MVDTAKPQIRLHAFPSDDWEFRQFARDQLAQLDEPTPDRLQAAVRERYPLATVSVRSALAELESDEPLWYAFRHGPASPPTDEWWIGMETWAILHADRTVLEATDALAAIVEVPAELMIGRRVEDFANPADTTAADDIAQLWTALRRLGTLHGTLRFNRLDGTAREIEYHVEVDPANPRQYRAVIRER